MASDIRVVFTTAGDEAQANEIAQALVARHQAACVNICPGVRSIYRWKGKVWDDEELLLIIKTTSDRLEDVAATLREVHSYELPEMLTVEISGGSDQVLAWIRDITRPGQPDDDD